MAKKRKITQICLNPHVPLDDDFAFLALCNDGSLWHGYIEGALLIWKGPATDIPDDASPLSQLGYEIRNKILCETRRSEVAF